MTGYRLDSAKLRELRLAVPLTVDELADRAGLTYASVLKLEQGKQHPRIETVRQLAIALGCDPSDLMIVDVSEQSA